MVRITFNHAAMIVACWVWLAVPAVAAAPPQQLNREGLDLLDRHQPQAAIEKFRAALELQPENDVLRKNLALAYLAGGIAALNARDFESSLRLLGDGRRYAPDDFRFPYYAGYVHLRQGALSQAEVALNESLGMAPDRAEIHQLLGRLYYSAGRMYEALDSLGRARGLAPEDEEILTLLEKIRREHAVEAGMQRAHGGQFSVSYVEGKAATLGDEVLDILEDAYVEVGTLLNSFPELKVPVIIYAREDFLAVTGTPGWVGGVYDGKIRISLGSHKQVDDRLRGVLFHEYGHVVIRHLTRGHCPVWLHEGLAEIFGRSRFDPPLQRFPDALRQGRLFDFQTLEGPMQRLSPADVQLAYEQSYHFVAYLIDAFGWHVMGDLLAAYADGLSTPAAFGRAFGDYALGFEAILENWRQRAVLED